MLMNYDGKFQDGDVRVKLNMYDFFQGNNCVI